jgi:outer membrane receptor for ferrienterochelin and colicins
MKHALFTFLGILLSIMVAAQNGTITGKVTDTETGNALAGATVLLKGTNLGVVSGNDGQFILSGIPAGNQTVTASFVGYGTVEKNVTISSGQTTTVDFALAESAMMGEEVVVSATRRPEKITQAPAAISVITAKDLDQLASFNVGELASKIQGVEFVRTGVNGVGINARGFNNAFNAKILAMTDGRNSMMAGGSGLPVGIMNTIIKEDIERVEVVLGPNSALYGPNAHNGIVNTITKDPRRYQGTMVALDFGNQSVFSARLRHAMKLSDKLAFKVTGEHTQGNDFAFADSVYVGGTFVAGVGNLYGALRPKPTSSFLTGAVSTTSWRSTT